MSLTITYFILTLPICINDKAISYYLLYLNLKVRAGKSEHKWWNAYWISSCIRAFWCNTCFQHPNWRTYTWTSPDGATRNQTDYFAVTKQYHEYILDSKSFPGDECDTNYMLLRTKLRIWLRKQLTGYHTIRSNTETLKNPTTVERIVETYSGAIKNRFEVLVQEFDTECHPEGL